MQYVFYLNAFKILGIIKSLYLTFAVSLRACGKPVGGIKNITHLVHLMDRQPVSNLEIYQKFPFFNFCYITLFSDDDSDSDSDSEISVMCISSDMSDSSDEEVVLLDDDGGEEPLSKRKVV